MRVSESQQVEAYEAQVRDLWKEIDEASRALPTTDEWPSELELREIDSELLREDRSVDDDDSGYEQAERYLYGRAVRQMAERMQRYVADKDFDKTEGVWSEITQHIQHASYPGALTSHMVDSITDLIAELVEKRPLAIYEFAPAKSLIEIPERLVVGVNELFAQSAAKNPRLLRSMSPRDFERFIAEVFSGFGYEVELTAPTRDGGADIVAISRKHGITLKLIVECKRYLPPTNVGVGHIRSLLGVKHHVGANKALLATTSYFTKPARDFAERHFLDLELKDYEAVAEWSREYADILARIRND